MASKEAEDEVMMGDGQRGDEGDMKEGDIAGAGAGAGASAGAGAGGSSSASSASAPPATATTATPASVSAAPALTAVPITTAATVGPTPEATSAAPAPTAAPAPAPAPAPALPAAATSVTVDPTSSAAKPDPSSSAAPNKEGEETEGDVSTAEMAGIPVQASAASKAKTASAATALKTPTPPTSAKPDDAAGSAPSNVPATSAQSSSAAAPSASAPTTTTASTASGADVPAAGGSTSAPTTRATRRSTRSSSQAAGSGRAAAGGAGGSKGTPAQSSASAIRAAENDVLSSFLPGVSSLESLRTQSALAEVLSCPAREIQTYFKNPKFAKDGCRPCRGSFCGGAPPSSVIRREHLLDSDHTGAILQCQIVIATHLPPGVLCSVCSGTEGDPHVRWIEHFPEGGCIAHFDDFNSYRAAIKKSSSNKHAPFPALFQQRIDVSRDFHSGEVTVQRSFNSLGLSSMKMRDVGLEYYAMGEAADRLDGSDYECLVTPGTATSFPKIICALELNRGDLPITSQNCSKEWRRVVSGAKPINPKDVFDPRVDLPASLIITLKLSTGQVFRLYTPQLNINNGHANVALALRKSRMAKAAAADAAKRAHNDSLLGYAREYGSPVGVGDGTPASVGGAPGTNASPGASPATGAGAGAGAGVPAGRSRKSIPQPAGGLSGIPTAASPSSARGAAESAVGAGIPVAVTRKRGAVDPTSLTQQPKMARVAGAADGSNHYQVVVMPASGSGATGYPSGVSSSPANGTNGAGTPFSYSDGADPASGSPVVHVASQPHGAAGIPDTASPAARRSHVGIPPAPAGIPNRRTQPASASL